jgi:hypothetical protein
VPLAAVAKNLCVTGIAGNEPRTSAARYPATTGSARSRH